MSESQITRNIPQIQQFQAKLETRAEYRSQNSIYDSSQKHIQNEEHQEQHPNAHGKNKGNILADQFQYEAVRHQAQNYNYEDREQIIQLRQQLRIREEQIRHKNSIIKQLQERCATIGVYQRKIQLLQSKASQLQKLLQNLQNSKLSPSPSATSRLNKKTKEEKTILQAQQYILREHSKNQIDGRKSLISLKQEKMSSDFKNDIKQNRKSSLKPKDTKKLIQAMLEDASRNSKKQKQKSSERVHTQYTQKTQKTQKSLPLAASSKFLQFNKHQDEKIKQIDKKFNKMKQNINTQPKSTKNIQQIYSLLNNKKLRKQQLAIKEINDKLQQILNESARINSTRQSHDQNISFTSYDNKHKTQWRPSTQRSSYQYVKTHSFNQAFKPNFLTNNRQKSYTMHDSDLFYRPSFPKDSLSSARVDSNKFKRMLNATNVDEVLKARKCISGVNNFSKNFLNKSTESSYCKTAKSKLLFR